MATTGKCDSQVFKDWSAKVDNILSQLPKTDMSGEPLEYQDDAYQEVITVLYALRRYAYLSNQRSYCK